MSAVLIFGELLFDQFPSGETVLGGAPMNVAWHLHAFGIPVKMISRVGDDRLGQQARTFLEQAGLDVSEIQSDSTHATGTVNVQLEQGTPRFDIVNDVAYDHIQFPDAATLQQPYQLLYHGSLALRNPVSKATLEQIRANVSCPIFVDVNLRPPFWSKGLLQSLIRGANWVKLNHEELAMLANKTVIQDRLRLINTAQVYRADNALAALIVTCGADGAFIVTAEQVYDMPPVIPSAIIDTVGAGDAFSAMTIAGLTLGWDYQQILAQASEFAARICGIRGAIPPQDFRYPELTHN